MSGDNTHNSDRDLRSSPQAFHLEKGPFFSKDSNTSQSLRQFGKGASSWGTEEEGSFNKLSRQAQSGAGKSIQWTGPRSSTREESTGNLKSIRHSFPVPPLISTQKKDPSISTGVARGEWNTANAPDFYWQRLCIRDFILFSKGGEKRNHLCHSKDTEGKGTPLKGLESYFSWESRRKKLESPFWGWGVCRSDRRKLFHQQSKYGDWKRAALTSREGLIASVDKGKAASPIRSSRPVCPNSLLPRLL